MLKVIVLLLSIYHVYAYTVTHRVTFEIQKDNEYIGNIVLGLYGSVVPKTVKNFVQFCKGYEYKGKHYSYVGVPFHRIIPNFMIQGGDVVNQNGTGSISIFGQTFDDENFTIKHSKRGLIAMANRGPHTNGSQFFITTVITSWLNNKHVVFGEVLEGDYVVQAVESVGSGEGRPKATVVISKATVEEVGEL
ncbi:peptidyl-prolyl cis-trans isomerase protein, putative [Theileria equi strain WA]|uniref:Peptidyl-prolyl cis-trans isomerase n=1 Tax=Theileria equi strain WA TaxID=1537102 RepID=L0ATH3_THEEQ|nr:peptidyl-prolyl cis-trans isomerase protein, putative [Theileria equi strain WA]AFZ78937.1 peptidyl-prolyl cis-trans isomerase protein, putative [Theileria equi strain WA]|eukprot:XP_004828603.1 peptidyl-prolyl cis-trans isomerase protein, putative [Theileria equi strain WA]